MKIGIVSGMGASAGSYFYKTLIEICQERGAKKDSDFPEIFLHNIPSQGMDEKGIRFPKIVRSELLNSIRILNECGSEVIVIACNSVHIFLDYLSKYSKARIVGLMEGVSDVEDPAVICSSTTKKHRLYQGIQTTAKQQKVVDNIIDRVISGKLNYKDKESLGRIVKSLKRKGAKNVILGCTELPLVGVKGCIDPSRIMFERLL